MHLAPAASAVDVARGEVAHAFERYEEALRRNDVAVLRSFFLDSPAVVRFGVADHQVGADQLDHWRRRQPAIPPGRTLSDTRVLMLGPDTAVVTTLFSYPGSPGELGRQSQTWLRTAGSGTVTDVPDVPDERSADDCQWRIVSAHVSVVADYRRRR